jgi:hypothetical protein
MKEEKKVSVLGKALRLISKSNEPKQDRKFKEVKPGVWVIERG